MNAGKQVCGRRLADEQADLVVEVFRMLSDSTRVQLLWALADRELAVNDLAGRVGKPAPSVSQHLAKLHNAEHAAGGGVPAHHLDDGELRLLHEDGTG